jgi:hypothetical protein
MLTAMQRQVAEIIAGLDAANGFGLAGGAALILRRDIDRRTRDLDFFGLDSSDVQRLLPEAEGALEAAGYQVHRVRESVSFVRLAVERDGEVTEVDFAADARLFPLDFEEGLPVLSPTELAVDKMLAIFGRWSTAMDWLTCSDLPLKKIRDSRSKSSPRCSEDSLVFVLTSSESPQPPTSI